MTRASALFALAIVGQGCALQLIDVRPYAVFQHYQPWEWLLGAPPAVWGVLAQTVIVVALAWRTRARLRAAWAGVVPVRAWLVVAVLGGFSLAVPSVSVARYFGEVVLAGSLAIVAALNLVLAVLALPDATLERLPSWADARVTLRPDATGTRRWDRALPVVVAIWVTVAAAVTSYVVLERVPHIDDSVSNLFQAKYFSAGRLFLPAPPDAESFRMDLTVIDARKWYGYAFPGWPAVLALGVLAGVPWLVNPVVGGLLILFGHAWIRRRWDRATANIAVLLLAVSSWLIFTSAELMGHPLTATLAALALLAFDRAADRAPRWLWWAAVAGIATGALMLTRALDGVLVAAALGVTLLTDRRLLRGLPALIVTGLVTAGVAALILPYNQAVTGRATYPAHVAWADGRYGPGVDVMGFGPKVGIDRWPNLDPLPGHGPADVVLNANKNFFMVNADLFGWAIGSLVFVWLALGIGRWRRADGSALALAAIFIAGYSLFWFSGGPDLGARYWYPLLLPLAALTARGAQMLAGEFRRRATLSHAGVRIGVMLLAASAGAAVTMLPWRAVTKHYRYRGISGEVRELANATGFGRALVFVRAGERSDYQSAYILNPPTLDHSGPIYALDAGPAHRAALIARFADRPVWIIGRQPQSTGGARPFGVIAGPLAPGTNPQ
jgi:hypothetical protein